MWTDAVLSSWSCRLRGRFFMQLQNEVNKPTVFQGFYSEPFGQQWKKIASISCWFCCSTKIWAADRDTNHAYIAGEKNVSNTSGKQDMEDLIKYNFYKYLSYFGVLLVPWHCSCSSPCSGWVTDIELHVQIRTMSRAPGSQLEQIWQTLASVPISSISPVAHVCSQHCALHLTLLLNYNPAHLFYNTNLIGITREIPAAGTENLFRRAGK